MRKVYYWLWPILWAGVIFYSSAQPYKNQDVKPFLTNFDLSFLTPFLDGISFHYHHAEISVDALGIAGFIEFFMRKGAHFTVFFILMCLFYLAFKKSAQLNVRLALTISFLLTVAYAGTDEFHQSFTSQRTPYIGDVCIDVIGALAACLILLYMHQLKRRRQTKK